MHIIAYFVTALIYFSFVYLLEVEIDNYENDNFYCTMINKKDSWPVISFIIIFVCLAQLGLMIYILVMSYYAS